MKIYLFRHGETDWNVTHRVQGHSDIPLNANGIRQAEIVARRIADIRFDAVFASPLKRAAKTAEIMAKGLPICFDDRLIEIGFGVEEGDDLEHIAMDENDPLHDFIMAPEKYNPPAGAESIDDVWKRFMAFFEEKVLPLEEETVCSSEGGEERNILIVSHGALARAVTCNLSGRPYERFWGTKKMTNLALNLLELKDGRLTLIEEARDMLPPEELMPEHRVYAEAVKRIL